MKENSPQSFIGTEDIIVFHGDDELEIKNDLSRIMGDSHGFADLNVSRINAAEDSLSDIQMQLNMLPMGAGKRKVILENAQEIIFYKKDKDWFVSIIENFPPSAQLILILSDYKTYKGWKKFKPSHWIHKAIQSFPGSAFWQERPLPDAKHMPQWIENKVIEFGGRIHPAAAHTLANLVGNDLFQVEQEISKAVSYCGEDGQITVEIVRLLCAATTEEDIFVLVDAVGQRDSKSALRVYQKLVIDSSAQYIFSMLVRQLRLILQTRILLDKNGTVKKIAEVCDLKSEWQAKKLINQARRFNRNELIKVYRQLDRIDEDSKAGKISIDAAIEPLLAAITHQ